MQHTTSTFEVRPGCSLSTQAWRTPQGTSPLVIVHGGGEHAGRYAETASRLAEAGYAVHALDLPGHGRSPGIRGHIGRFEDYEACVHAFLQWTAMRHEGRRPVLLGHSLGGLIATGVAAAHPQAVACLVLSSPLWGLSAPIPRWKRAVARLLDPVWPSLTMARPRHNGAVLSHDPRVEAAYRSDPLVHPLASVRLYAEIRRQFALLPSLLPRLCMPVLVLQAGDDRLASSEAVRRLFPLVGSSRKRLIVYEGFYHEVLNEIERARVLGDLLQWLAEENTR